MGLWRIWKQAKAMAATGTRDGRAPRDAKEFGAGFMGAYLRMVSPLIASKAPERGAPLPGTEPDLLAGPAPNAVAGVDAIRARDPAFDPVLLTAFAHQVYGAVAQAWANADAASVRDVLADDLWDPLAAASMSPVGAGAGQVFAREEGRPTLTGAWAGNWYDSALFHFDVHIDLPPQPGGKASNAPTEWAEEWLFQRSVTPGGNPMCRPEACPSCGAPTTTTDDGACTHCRTPIPVLTSGWLVTWVRSDNTRFDLMRSHTTGTLPVPDPDHFGGIPPEFVELLPDDVRTMIRARRGAPPPPAGTRG